MTTPRPPHSKIWGGRDHPIHLRIDAYENASCMGSRLGTLLSMNSCDSSNQLYYNQQWQGSQAV